jgi:hypothetical protein
MVSSARAIVSSGAGLRGPAFRLLQRMTRDGAAPLAELAAKSGIANWVCALPRPQEPACAASSLPDTKLAAGSRFWNMPATFACPFR